MKIAFLSTEDPQDKDVFSGSTFNILQALRNAGAEVTCIGPIDSSPSRAERYLRKKFPKLDRYRPWPFAPTRLRSIASTARERLKACSHDIILSRSTWPLAYLETEKPVAIWHDATFKLLCVGYSGYADQGPKARRWGEAVDQMAFGKAALGIFTSNWAANSATNSAGLRAGSARRVFLGANRPCLLPEKQLREIAAQRDLTKLKLLFIGTEWHRKGGNLFVSLIKQLQAMQVPVEANMVGPWPPSHEELPTCIRCYGRVSFKNPNGAALIQDLMLNSNYFILPTRHDCTPVVIPDALSHCLPVLAHATGGIPEMVQDSFGAATDFMCPGGIESIADYLRQLLRNPDQWRAQAQCARDEYQNVQNWERHGVEIVKLLESVLGAKAGRV